MSQIHHNFTVPLLKWFEIHGRKDLPWQQPRDAYRVWVSEIMLQQTQVKTVIPYFIRFIDRFPTVNSLAIAAEDDVLSLWSGLGYYSRGRNLHRTAAIVVEQYQGIFPSDFNQLRSLPGIGDSTAAAIASLAYNKPMAILDGNVKRVLSRYFLVSGSTEQSSVKKILWQLAAQCMSQDSCAEYTQAIMDLGATCCTNKNPQCSICPLQASCIAYQQGVVANYPQKKNKIRKPSKEQQFLVLYYDQASIYLEKRPPVGLWGGLWCLPMIDTEQNACDYIERNHGLSTNNINNLITIKHSFSHFNLTIKAVSLQISAKKNTIKETSGRWVSRGELDDLGLAKPVRTIIDYFFAES